MPTGALAITARIFSSSSSLALRHSAFWRNTCWNTRASSPSSPPVCGHGSWAAKPSLMQAQRAASRAGRNGRTQCQRHQQDDPAAGHGHRGADQDRLAPPGGRAAQQHFGRGAAEHHPVGIGHAGHRDDVVAEAARRALRLDRRRLRPSIAPPRRRSADRTPPPCASPTSRPCARRWCRRHRRSTVTTGLVVVHRGTREVVEQRVGRRSSFMPPIRIAVRRPSRSNSGIVMTNIAIPLVRLTPGCEMTGLRRSRTVRRRYVAIRQASMSVPRTLLRRSRRRRPGAGAHRR